MTRYSTYGVYQFKYFSLPVHECLRGSYAIQEKNAISEMCHLRRKRVQLFEPWNKFLEMHFAKHFLFWVNSQAKAVTLGQTAVDNNLMEKYGFIWFCITDPCIINVFRWFHNRSYESASEKADCVDAYDLFSV